MSTRSRRLRPLSGLAVLFLLGTVAACAGDPKPGGGGQGGSNNGTGGGGGGARGGNSGNGGSGSGQGGSNPGGNGGSGSGQGGSGGGSVMLNPAAGKVEDGPFTCNTTSDAGGFTFEKIAEWRDDATAAYTMIHDDMCGPQLRGIDQIAVPALDLRNLKATLGPFVEVCENAKLWEVVAAAQNKGHEIANHSYTHPNIRMENAGKEVMMAKMVFDSKLPKPVTFFIFPYDDFSAPTIELVKMAGHIGARAGNRDDNNGFNMPPVNERDGLDKDMILEFDAWPRGYSKYTSFREDQILDLHVHYAIEKQGFAVREFHSVTPKDSSSVPGEGFGPVPLRQYEKHLDFLYNAWKANKVWTSTASTIIRYRKARQTCKAAVSGNKITFDTSNAMCAQYATPISVVLTTASDLPGVKAIQGGNPVSVRKLGAKRYAVTASPTGGEVTLEGCMEAAPGVDTSVTLPAKPAPAATVCDLESAMGTGSPGKMDDLERAPDALQVLPNPAQGDNRNGSWSWYPQTSTAAIQKEGNNSVLKWNGSMLKAWAGVTLAFMGGNGAGTCYDASAYKGVRFKIKGTVTAPAAPLYNGKVIVSMVSAETQSQSYGGDLKDSGGHFNAIIPITAEWTTVELTWDKFLRPTWGTTMALPALANKKLQALDWGVADVVDSFELFLDDIELF